MSDYLTSRRDVVHSPREPGWNYGHGRSPFYSYDLAQGAQYCIYNRRMMPVSLASITRDDGYWALRRGVTRLDTGELPTAITGPGSAALLDRLFTRRPSELAVGRCGYGIACWPDGGILVDGIVIRLATDSFWYCQADGDFVGWLRAHAENYDVQIDDPQSYVHQIQGPRALDLLADLCDDGMPDDFRYFAARTVTIGGQNVLITRTGWTGEIGFEIYTQPGLDAARLWDTVTRAGGRYGLVDIGLDSMDARRIEAGILNNLSDMDATMNPFEAGLGDFVDLSRSDDFFGKQALLATDRRHTRIYGLQVATAEPLIGAPVKRDNRQVGVVTAASYSPLLKCGIGYVRLNSAAAAEGGAAEVIGFDLESHSCEIARLPFYDRQKAIARGIETVNV